MHQNEVRTAYISFIKRNNPRYFLTLTMKPSLNDNASKAVVDKFLIHLNKDIFKKQYLRGNLSIEGICSVEKALVKKQQYSAILDTPHYHFVLFENGYSLPSQDAFHKKLSRQVKYINRGPTGVLKNHCEQAKDLVMQHRDRGLIREIDLREYFNDGGDGLEHYVTKNFNKWSWPSDRAADSVGILGREGVHFGSFFTN